MWLRPRTAVSSVLGLNPRSLCVFFIVVLLILDWDQCSWVADICTFFALQQTVWGLEIVSLAIYRAFVLQLCPGYICFSQLQLACWCLSILLLQKDQQLLLTYSRRILVYFGIGASWRRVEMRGTSGAERIEKEAEIEKMRERERERSIYCWQKYRWWEKRMFLLFSLFDFKWYCAHSFCLSASKLWHQSWVFLQDFMLQVLFVCLLLFFVGLRI